VSESDGGSPTLISAIRKAIEARMFDIHTALPGKVVSFDAASRTASVQPILIRILIDEDGEEEPQRMPQLPGVPVIMPSGGGWEISFELEPGDLVWLVFSERALDRWKANPSQEHDPVWDRKFDLSDAVAFPGARPFTTRKDGTPVQPTAPIRIGRLDGSQFIELRPDGSAVIEAQSVLIGTGAAGDDGSPIAKAVPLTEWLAGHTHPTAFGPSGPAAASMNGPPTDAGISSTTSRTN